MPRIPPPTCDQAPESVRRLLAPEPPNEIALLFGHAATHWPRIADLLLSILSEQSLDERLRELAILRVANLRRAEFEWDQHVGISQAAGVSREQLEAIAAGRIEAPCFDARAKLMNALDLESKGPIDPEFAAAVNRGGVARVSTANSR